MTRDEAEELEKIFLTVDGGCSVCIGSICLDATEANLGWKWIYEEGHYNILEDIRTKDVILVEPK